MWHGDCVSIVDFVCDCVLLKASSSDISYVVGGSNVGTYAGYAPLTLDSRAKERRKGGTPAHHGS